MHDSIVAVMKALPEFLAAYDMTPSGDAQLIEKGEDNLNISVPVGERRVVVRRYEHTSRSGIAFELDTVEHLSEIGFPVPALYRTTPNERTRDLVGRPAAVFKFVEGESPRIDDEAMWPLVGEWLAHYHVAIAGFMPAHTKQYTELSELERAKRLAGKMRQLRYDDFLGHIAEFEVQYGRLLRTVLPTLPTGVIHADFRPDNLLCRSGKLVAVLDFDTSYPGTFARDLAETVVIWSIPQGQVRANSQIARSVVAGYCGERALSKAEEQTLRAEILLACLSDAIRFTCSRIEWGDPLVSADECSMYVRYKALREGEPLL